MVDCHHPPTGFSCERCGPSDRCAYSVHYTEGSSISGHVITDVAHFGRSVLGSREMDAVSARVYFGCQTSETGMFFRQEADGIMGLQPPRYRARVPSLLTSLVQQKPARDIFSLCLADRTGLFLLGGAPDAAAMRARGALTLPMDRGARARYTLNLAEVRISGANAANGTFHSLRLAPSTYSPTLVDSGTTFVYASTPLYRELQARLQQATPALVREGGKICAFLTEAQLASMPNIQFVFAAARATPLLIRPLQYMVEFPRTSTTRPGRHLCAAIFDNQRGGTVIGASIMRHREVVFDIASSSISFVDADCQTTTPAKSLMRGAYSFAACPPRNASTRRLATGHAGPISPDLHGAAAVSAAGRPAVPMPPDLARSRHRPTVPTPLQSGGGWRLWPFGKGASASERGTSPAGGAHGARHPSRTPPHARPAAGADHGVKDGSSKTVRRMVALRSRQPAPRTTTATASSPAAARAAD